MEQKYEVIEIRKELEYIDEFINLPSKIYKKKEIMQNDVELRQILMGEHILSKYFDIHKYIVVDSKNNVIGRAILTLYEKDKNAYIGYYECLNNKEASFRLLDYIIRAVAREGYTNLVGPVNCALWLGYGFKTNNYDLPPYFGEIYNKDYYIEQFKNAGFETLDNYTTCRYDKMKKTGKSEIYARKLKEMQLMGYEFKEATPEEFESQLRLVGLMLMDQYTELAGFKKIDIDDFYDMYKNVKKFVNFDMIKLAYYKDELVGFFFGIPDYSNLLRDRSIIKAYTKKAFTNNYVLVSMCIKNKNEDLANSMVEFMRQEIEKKHARVIGTLIKNSGTKRPYFNQFVNKENTYETYTKKLNY